MVDSADAPPFSLAVMLQRRPSSHAWRPDSWRITGVVVNSQWQHPEKRRVRSAPDGTEDYLWGGFRLRLHKDEAESYYFNLLAEQPSLYVVSRMGPRYAPEPFLVTASFDEAHAYMEAEEDAQPVPMPPELHGWIEAFVLEHYVPERRRKRKRQNWKDGE